MSIESLLQTMSYEDDDIRRQAETLFETMPEDIRACCFPLRKVRGESITKTGSDADKVFFLLKGRAKIMNELPDGVLYSFAAVSAPALLGETEAFAELPFYRGTVVCETECRMVSMSSEVFLRWMHISHAALYTITASIVRKNCMQNSHDRALLFYTGVNRIAFHLLEYCTFPHAGGDFELKISREQLADEVGTSVKTVNRCLAQLEEQGLMNRRGHSICISKQQSIDIQHFLSIGRK